VNWLTKRREPFRFMLVLGLGGSVLIFGFLLLIYLARKGATGWEDVALPRIFWLSTAAMLNSSYTLHSANVAFRHERFLNYRIMMGATLALGLLFVVLQVLGWAEMLRGGVRLGPNVAGAFIYVISGLHVFHILIGLIFLIIVFRDALRNKRYLDAFVYSVNPPNQLKLSLVTFYWHFVDALWLVLFAFLLYHHPN
jgi:cytochrome c oxidase subunit 3